MKPEEKKQGVRQLLVAVVAMVLIVAGPLASSYTNRKYQNPGKSIKLEAVVLPGWAKLADIQDRDVKPRVQKADFSMEARYAKGDDVIDLYIYGYTSNQGGKEIINHENTAYDRKLWVKAKQGQYHVKGGSAEGITVNEVLVSNGKTERLIHYFYSVGGDFVHSPYKVKSKEILLKLFSQDLDSRLYVISTNAKNGIPAAREVLINLEHVLIAGK